LGGLLHSKNGGEKGKDRKSLSETNSRRGAQEKEKKKVLPKGNAEIREAGNGFLTRGDTVWWGEVSATAEREGLVNEKGRKDKSQQLDKGL